MERVLTSGLLEAIAQSENLAKTETGQSNGQKML